MLTPNTIIILFVVILKIRLSRTCDDKLSLYFVGWVRRGKIFDDKPMAFDSRRNPPDRHL